MKNLPCSKAVVIFGHGARDPQWADPMRHLKSLLLAENPNCRVELAFLELMEPDLISCVDALVADGVACIDIVPLFFGKGGHLKRDFPLLLEALRQKDPNIQIKATTPVGQWDAVWKAIAHEINLLIYK